MDSYAQIVESVKDRVGSIHSQAQDEASSAQQSLVDQAASKVSELRMKGREILEGEGSTGGVIAAGHQAYKYSSKIYSKYKGKQADALNEERLSNLSDGKQAEVDAKVQQGATSEEATDKFGDMGSLRAEEAGKEGAAEYNRGLKSSALGEAEEVSDAPLQSLGGGAAGADALDAPLLETGTEATGFLGGVSDAVSSAAATVGEAGAAVFGAVESVASALGPAGLVIGAVAGVVEGFRDLFHHPKHKAINTIDPSSLGAPAASLTGQLSQALPTEGGIKDHFASQAAF